MGMNAFGNHTNIAFYKQKGAKIELLNLNKLNFEKQLKRQ
jgi:hypothetical protein